LEILKNIKKMNIEEEVENNKIMKNSQKQKLNLKSKYKSIWINWLSKTSAHGVPIIIRAKYKPLKLIWIIFFIICVCYFIISLVKLSIRYSEYNTKTSYSIVNELSVEFPAIDICNLNPSQTYDKDLKDLLFFYPYNMTNSINYLDRLQDNILSYLYIGGIVAGIGPYFPYQIDQMIISCKFDGVECNKNDFYMYSDYNYGMCFRFNGGIVKTVSGSQKSDFGFDNQYSQEKREKKRIYDAGSKTGLKMELFVGNPESNWFTNKNGIRLTIHNGNAYPFNDGIDISTGKSVHIGVTKNVMNKLSSPYSNCISDLDEALKQYKNSNKFTFLNQMKNVHNMTDYSQSFCIRLCQQKYIESQCKCYDPRLPVPNDIIQANFKSSFMEYNYALAFLDDERYTSPCNPFNRNDLSEYICLNNKTEEFKSSGLQKCLRDCPSECSSIDFSKEISELDYPSDQ
jgi:hypothetical protein